MKRYIRCHYCGTVLGEIKGFDDEHEYDEIYCIGCYAEYKYRRSKKDREWDEMVAPYE